MLGGPPMGLEPFPTSYGLVLKGEDGLDDGGRAGRGATGLSQDVPAFEGGGDLLARARTRRGAG